MPQWNDLFLISVWQGIYILTGTLIMTRIYRTLGLLIGILFLLGCASKWSVESEKDADIVAASHTAANALIQQVQGKVESNRPFLAASFVDINDLEQTTSFGRIVSQQLVTQFSNNGFVVVEMLLRKNIYIKQKGGEFLLSRAVREISKTHDAGAVIVGTYAVGARSVYITAKVIDTIDNTVLGSFDYKLPKGPDTDYLLKSSSS